MAVIQEKNKKKWTKDGRSWYFDVYYIDMYGNKKEKKSKYYRLRKEAEAAERDFLSKAEICDEANHDILFIDVYNEWLSYKSSQVKSTTYYSVVKRSEYHILPYFKKFKLHNIKINNILNWKNNLANTNISLGHQNTLIRTLKEILTYARDNYDFDIKIVSKLQMYKIETVISEKDSEVNFWTYDEFQVFINIVDDELYKLVFTFLYFTGLRSGEMIALTWDDINLDKKTLRINKTFTNKVIGSGYKIISPKTNNSIRIIDLDDELVDLLQRHRNQEEKIYNFNNKMFIFGNARYIPPTTLKNKLYKYIDIINKNRDENNKFKRITPHGFRHSHVSLLINLGCNSRDVAERIGDTVQTVEKVYYHMFPEIKKKPVKFLNNLKK